MWKKREYWWILQTIIIQEDMTSSSFVRCSSQRGSEQWDFRIFFKEFQSCSIFITLIFDELLIYLTRIQMENYHERSSMMAGINLGLDSLCLKLMSYMKSWMRIEVGKSIKMNSLKHLHNRLIMPTHLRLKSESRTQYLWRLKHSQIPLHCL